MDKILVHGGRKLNGTVRISGSKNSALPILAAALLTRERCVIRGVPDLSDIHYMLTILSSLGCEVERASGTVIIKAEKSAPKRLMNSFAKCALRFACSVRSSGANTKPVSPSPAVA